jgi:hypothetical protein
LPLGLRRASAPGAGLAPTPAQCGMARGDDPLLGPRGLGAIRGPPNGMKDSSWLPWVTGSLRAGELDALFEVHRDRFEVESVGLVSPLPCRGHNLRIDPVAP